jgi:uncharacterized membrane-anchored protein
MVVAGERSMARRQRTWKTLLVAVGMVAMIALSTANVIGLLPASLALSCVFILLRCISLAQAERAIQVRPGTAQPLTTRVSLTQAHTR